MGKRIKLTKTDVFLLGLTVLFVLAMALTWLLKVNINTAGAEELDGLPGIGPVLAQRIVDEREANGPYTGAEDLTRVEGIGQAIVESIQDHIITEDTQE